MIRQISALLFLALAVQAVPGAVRAGEFAARARLEAAGSSVTDRAGAVEITLALTQGVPWRVFTLDAPRRLVVDFREVSLEGIDPVALERSTQVSGLRMGLFRPGWSRLVLELDTPLIVAEAGMTTDEESGAARIRIRLRAASAAAFAEAAGAPPAALWPRPDPAAPAPRRRQMGDRKLIVVLDPGHGGLDPGAERAGQSEAGLMLAFARELKEVLILSSRYRVIMTREEDVFVPLQERVSIARAVGADVFLSLHADALAEGRARGASVYTLSETATDEAAARLAESHDRAELLVGVDLSEQDDVVAGVLMELAQAETGPRSERLARKLVEGITARAGPMHKHAQQRAGFSVLKAPEIPSALIEIGFLSSPRDLAQLTDSVWRRRFAEGVLAGLDAWMLEDAAEARLLRQ